MHNTRVQKVDQDIFNKVKALASKYPNATKKEIGRLIYSGGGLSSCTVRKICKCNIWEDYLEENLKLKKQYWEKKNMMGGKQMTIAPVPAESGKFERLACLFEEVAKELRNLGGNA